jgi:hypothetical protein
LPSVRCETFNDLLWTYVTEIARRKKISRCNALETIVEEHMKFMAKIEQERKKPGKR